MSRALDLARRRGYKKLTLVKAMPNRVKIGTLLTDGPDIYKVLDSHQRVDGWWFRLENTRIPEGRKEWFHIRDLGELAFVERQQPKARRFGVIGGTR